jgi:superfamily II DNA or RNA helicase
MSSKKNNLDISNKITNFINKNDIIEPLNWVLPNRKEFISWINETFIKYRADGKLYPLTGKFTPFKYQKLLRDYMQNNSPYRGILLYHGLGSGKTCSAITISENLKTERNVVVMLPASLRTNFIEDGLMFCGSSKYKDNPELYKEKYSFISYNANNTTAQIKKIGSLDNKVIIIEEVHNLISKIMSGINGTSKQGLEIYNFLMNAQNAKIIALSGTPLINDPFEVAILFNILRGYIELTYFRILKVPGIYGEEWRLGDLEEELMSNNLIDYLEINKINKSIEFHIKVKSYSEKYREVLEFIEKTCLDKGLIVKFLEFKRNSLFSIEDDGEIFRNYFVKEDIEKGDRLKNENVFKRRILGLVSYYKSLNDNYPEVIHKDYYRVEMSNYQFQIYEILRAKERLTEKGSSKSKSKKSKNVKSTFRVFSRQASNFVFPEEINRPYPDPSFVVSILKKNNNQKNENINKILALEEKANNNGKLSIDYKNRIDSAIDKLIENGELYFKPGPNGLDKLSPKMKLMLENIQKSHGLIFVYSNFRTLEGIELFSKVLDFNGYSKYGTNDDKQKYAIYSGSEDEKEKKNILKIFTSNENKHGKFLKIILATSAGAEGLDLKNIRQIHIMEPYWNQMRIEQVIGRGVRRNSHSSLPINERNVEIFRYFSVYSKNNISIAKDKITTDEHIEHISLKKQTIINELIQILKECSFDCLLNANDIKGEYNCFSFGANASGFSYYPDISKDIIESYAIENKKKVKKVMTRVIYYNGLMYLFFIKNKKTIFYLYNDNNKNPVDIDITKAKALFVDKETNEVFNTSDVSSGNPIKIGVINEKNELKKKIK